jgi:hypothetical protein
MTDAIKNPSKFHAHTIKFPNEVHEGIKAVAADEDRPYTMAVVRLVKEALKARNEAANKASGA